MEKVEYKHEKKLKFDNQTCLIEKFLQTTSGSAGSFLPTVTIWTNDSSFIT